MTPNRPDTEVLVRERLRANADDLDALFVLAAIHARDGDLAKGMGVLDRVLWINPAYPGAWIFKANLHRMRGEHAEADRAVRRAEENR